MQTNCIPCSAERGKEISRPDDNDQPSADAFNINVEQQAYFRSKLLVWQQQLIKQIDAALNRPDEGSFGYSLESGEKIGGNPLLADPIATLSVETQELRERQRDSHNAA